MHEFACLTYRSVGLLTGAALTAGAQAQCYYTYTQIPNPPGWECDGQAINGLGHVAGYTSNLGDTHRAFVWTPETGTRLLPLPPGVHDMRAYGINDLGHVAGSMQTSTGPLGYFWDGSTYSVISPPAWATSTEAYAINNSDRVVGVARGGGTTHALSWQDGDAVDLGSIARGSSAEAVNSHGQIAGYAYEDLWLDARGFMLDSSGIAWLPHPPELVTSFAYALSNTGFAAGYGTNVPLGSPGLRYVGIVWTPGGIDLITSPSGFRDTIVKGVNDSGRVVGLFYLPSSRGFVWQDGHSSRLTDMIVPPGGPGILSAWAINNPGQIVAWVSSGTVRLDPTWMPGDFTGDCHVSVEDLTILLSNFGAGAGSYPRGDVDFDGDVDLSDLSILLAHWGE